MVTVAAIANIRPVRLPKKGIKLTPAQLVTDMLTRYPKVMAELAK